MGKLINVKPVNNELLADAIPAGAAAEKLVELGALKLKRAIKSKINDCNDSLKDIESRCEKAEQELNEFMKSAITKQTKGAFDSELKAIAKLNALLAPSAMHKRKHGLETDVSVSLQVDYKDAYGDDTSALYGASSGLSAAVCSSYLITSVKYTVESRLTVEGSRSKCYHKTFKLPTGVVKEAKKLAERISSLREAHSSLLDHKLAMLRARDTEVDDYIEEAKLVMYSSQIASSKGGKDVLAMLEQNIASFLERDAFKAPKLLK